MVEPMKPCPFCGGDGLMHRVSGVGKLWRVSCKNCDAASGAGRFSEEAATAAWNTRPSPPTGEIEALVERLEKTDSDWQEHCDRWVSRVRDTNPEAMTPELEAMLRKSLHGEAASALSEQSQRLHEYKLWWADELQKREASASRIRELEAERDEADRQAGSLQRELTRLQEQERARDNWMAEQKRAAGYSANVSFDTVWAEIFARATQQGDLPDDQ